MTFENNATEAQDSASNFDEQIEEILNDKTDSSDSISNQDIESSKTNEDGNIDKNNITKDCDFLNQDGEIDVESLLKSYQELKPLTKVKIEWQQEKALLEQKLEQARQLQTQINANVQNLNQNDSKEFSLTLEVAKAQSDEYMKYLHQVAEPDRVRGLLALYAKAPSNELLEQIEDEFSVDTIKKVSIFSERFKNQLIQNQEIQRFETIKQEAETFVQNSINDFPDWFKIPQFTNFFADALRAKGDNFETSVFVQHIENLKQYFIQEYLDSQKAQKENESEINSLKNLAPKNTQKTLSTKNISDYTPEELDKAIGDLV